MEVSRIEFLLKRFLDKTINEPEMIELHEVMSDESSKEMALEVFDQLIVREGPAKDYRSEDWESLYQRIVAADNEAVEEDGYSGAKVRSIDWKRWLSAAVVIGLLSLGVWWFANQESRDDSQEFIVQSNDVKAPESIHAIIKLDDGRVINLDETAIGSHEIAGVMKFVKKANGEISYETVDNSQKILYNTLVNPRGSKVINVTLSDGSKVWLNSGSSLRYPIVFAEDKREVVVEGEAYFEVASAAAPSSSPEGGGTLRNRIPFHVKSGGVVTEVLGTHFNVNGYGDEEGIKVTLLEGLVKVSNEVSNVKLNPGQQATLRQAQSDIKVMNNINVDEVMAWKNGKFVFNSSNIQTIMKQLERWYDVEVEFQDKVNNHFTGIISRDVNASQVLNMLEQTGVVDFDIKGKKVIVRKN